MPVKLKFIYYLWVPVNGFSKMMDIHWNCLEQYSHVFDETLFLVACDDKKNENVFFAIDKIKSLGFKNLEIKIVENLPSRESFYVKREIFDHLDNFDGLTFFAHTKGVSEYDSQFSLNNISAWISSLYFFNLSFIDDVKDKLINEKYLSYGTFGQDGDFITTKYKWIYSGTFFWINGTKLKKFIDENNIKIPTLYDWTTNIIFKDTPKMYSENILSSIYDLDYAYFKQTDLHQISYYNILEAIEKLYNKDELEQFYDFYHNIALRNVDISLNKICVYAICKNESKFVEQWYNSVKEADSIVVLDTGSTDDTVEKLKNLGVAVKQKEIKPWRFDVARNESMKLIPDDCNIRIFVDLDEYFNPGWSKIVKEEKIPTDEPCTLVFSYNRWGGMQTVERGINKLINGFKYPIHEEYIVEKGYKQIFLTDKVCLNHVPEDGKERDYYYDLSKLRYEEEKNVEGTKNFYSYLWYGYFLYEHEKYEEAIKIMNELLELKNSDLTDYHRIYTYKTLSSCYKGLNDTEKELSELFKAHCLDKTDCQIYNEISSIMYNKDIIFTKNFLKSNLEYVNKNDANGMGLYYTTLALSCYYTNEMEEALDYANKAVECVPNNETYNYNLKIIQENLNKHAE